jgi:hypothetical protein
MNTKESAEKVPEAESIKRVPAVKNPAQAS